MGVQAPALLYCGNIFVGLTSVTFLSAPLPVMKVNACDCYSFSVSSVQLTQFEDSQCHFFLVGWGQGSHHCVPQFPTPNSSHTTVPNPQLVAYHNFHSPVHPMSQPPAWRSRYLPLFDSSLDTGASHQCITPAQHMSSLIMKWLVVVHLGCQPQAAVQISAVGQLKDSTVICFYNIFTADLIITNFVLLSARHDSVLICACSMKLYW
jgi:hypothetical protein